MGRAFVLGSDSLYREAGYVGLSRAQARTDLYLVASTRFDRPGHEPADPIARLIADLGRSQAQTLASSDPPPPPDTTLAELRRERTRLLELIGPIPDAPTEQAAAGMAAARVITAEAEARLAAVDELPRRHRAAARAMAEADVATAARHQRRTEVAWRDEQHALETWRSWLQANTEPLQRYQLVQEAIAERHDRARGAVLSDPGPHLVEALGPAPVSGPNRERWSDAAVAIDRYRDRWGITDTEHPLGPEPTDPEQRRQRRIAELAIDDRRRSLGRDIDTGLEL